jgi:hypothetical protein
VSWFDERVAEPSRALLGRLAVGERVADLDGADLPTGIEQLFRREVLAQYDAWPRESTTDGSVVDVCVRTADQVLEVAGRLFIDFGGRQFPFRTVITVQPGGVVHVDGFIGDVDETTGEPPRWPADTLVLPLGDGSDLAVGRHQLPVEWTKVFSVQES